ncbi:MAG: hypothetical protein ACOVME_05235, partial [Rhodobacter sp.]
MPQGGGKPHSDRWNGEEIMTQEWFDSFVDDTLNGKWGDAAFRPFGSENRQHGRTLRRIAVPARGAGHSADGPKAAFRHRAQRAGQARGQHGRKSEKGTDRRKGSA